MNGEQLQRKLQDSVDGMLNTIDVERVRPQQKAAYMKMASCFDNKNATTAQIDACLANSSRFVQASQQIIQGEMNQFQNRLQRCVMDCEDAARDKFPDLDKNPTQLDKAQAHMLSGMSGCVEKHIALLKSVKQKIESDLDKLK